MSVKITKEVNSGKKKIIFFLFKPVIMLITNIIIGIDRPIKTRIFTAKIKFSIICEFIIMYPNPVKFFKIKKKVTGNAIK